MQMKPVSNTIEETKQYQEIRKRDNDSDGLDSVSKVSVTTPHSMSRRSADEVSYMSGISKTTT